MKIGLYVPSWPPGSMANGIITYASYLVPALRQLGHEVFIFTFNERSKQGDKHTINLRTFLKTRSLLDRALSRFAPNTRSSNRFSTALVSAIRQLSVECDLDVFEIEESFGWSVALSRASLIPVVVRVHGPWFLNRRFDNPGERSANRRRREKTEGVAIKLADFVTSPSELVLRAVRNHYRLGLAASRVIANPICTAANQKLWNAQANDNLLFVGRFDARKGGDVVIRAFAELAEPYPKLKLTFVGPDRGLKGADGIVRSFQQFVESCVPPECSSRINFHGQMTPWDVSALRIEHFVTIVASHYEIMPYAVLEAEALGCPIIATAVGGIPELIKDRRNGLLIPGGNEAALISACRRLLEDRALAARLGTQARQDCSKLYAPQRIAIETVKAYQAAIDVFKAKST